MKIKAVLFDLDGTLLPMDQDTFIKAYFGALVRMLAPHGYDPKTLVDAIWQGTAAMIKNNGEKLNEEAFFEVFRGYYGDRAYTDKHLFDEFYENDFDREVRPSCGYDAEAYPAVKQIRDMGYRVILATNPLFPSSATESRMSWVGFSPSDFELFTTYENSRHCKPNLDYYRDILEKIGLSGEECLMVGNDVGEDMIAEQLGMKTFLVTRDLINKQGKDISVYPRGDLSDLIEYIKTLK